MSIIDILDIKPNISVSVYYIFFFLKITELENIFGIKTENEQSKSKIWINLDLNRINPNRIYTLERGCESVIFYVLSA